MDLLAELEDMINNVSLDDEVTSENVARWQKLFGMTPDEAADEIGRFRSDLSRTSMSDESWSTVAEEKGSLGFDKESYEYSLKRKSPSQPVPTTISTPARGKYIVKLEGPISSAQAIQTTLGAQHPPEVLKSRQEESDSDTDVQALFCKVSAADRRILLDFLSRRHPEFRPTIVRLAMAEEDLGTHSRGPCLGAGVEYMLPHMRPNTEVVQRPAQNEYPVWYFFYGKLADPEILQSLLGANKVEPSRLLPAQIRGGKIKTWGGRYNALVDASPDDVVAGTAFLVRSREQEEALQFFETDMYEIVRCDIEMRDREVAGLVFRYCGPEEQLA